MTSSFGREAVDLRSHARMLHRISAFVPTLRKNRLEHAGDRVRDIADGAHASFAELPREPADPLRKHANLREGADRLLAELRREVVLEDALITFDRRRCEFVVASKLSSQDEPWSTMTLARGLVAFASRSSRSTSACRSARNVFAYCSACASVRAWSPGMRCALHFLFTSSTRCLTVH